MLYVKLKRTLKSKGVKDMEKDSIETIGVIGAGTMGNGIAQVAAESGYEVILADISIEYAAVGFKQIIKRLEKEVRKGKISGEEKDKILARIKIVAGLEGLKNADLIIEAAPEDKKIKTEIFVKLDEICPEKTIFASNTSSLSIKKLAFDTFAASDNTSSRLRKFVGMHFMNPAYVMKLVEIVKWYYTDPETIKIVVAVAEKMGKTPIVVEDSPGFVLNRALIPMINEAMYCLEKGIASKEDIDSIMKLGAGHPMGPLELADFIGLDVCLAILEVFEDELGEKYKPCPLLKKMVEAGKLGRKTGEGFYEYPKK